MRFGLRILNTGKQIGVFLAGAGITSVTRWETSGKTSKQHAWTLVSPPITFEELRMVRFVHCGLLAYSTWVRLYRHQFPWTRDSKPESQ